MIWTNIHLLKAPVGFSSSVHPNWHRLSSQRPLLCRAPQACSAIIHFPSCQWSHLSTGDHATLLLSSLWGSTALTGCSPNTSEWHTCTFYSLSTGGGRSSHLMLQHLSPAVSLPGSSFLHPFHRWLWGHFCSFRKGINSQRLCWVSHIEYCTYNVISAP